MMIMTTWQGVITIIMAMLGTMLTRFLPFLLFLDEEERDGETVLAPGRCVRASDLGLGGTERNQLSLCQGQRW